MKHLDLLSNFCTNCTCESCIKIKDSFNRELERLQKNQLDLEKLIEDLKEYKVVLKDKECVHDYNYSWYSTTPTYCKKCGKTLEIDTNITYNIKEE